MAQYEVSVFRYACDPDADKDGIEIQIYRTPALDGHISCLNDKNGFSRAESIIHNNYSEHYLGMQVPTEVGASHGAFSATIVDKIARGLEAKVQKLLFENSASCTASLLVGDKKYDPTAKNPGKAKVRDDYIDFYIPSPQLFFRNGRVTDKRTNVTEESTDSCKRKREE